MATADYFLKLDGIEGESVDQAHKNEIELDSFSWSGHLAASNTAGAGLGKGKVVPQSLDCVSKLAKDTPKLVTALCSGTHIASAILTARKSGGDGKQVDYATWKLTEVAISKFDIGAGEGSIPVVTFGLSFAKFEWSYKAQDAKGNVSVAATGGWDFKSNVKV